MLKEHDIKNYFEQYELPYKDESSIVGIIMPKKMTYLTKGSLAPFSTQYFIINFSKDATVIVSISNTTGNLVEDSHLVLPNEVIIEKKFDKKILAYELSIITTDGDLSFKVNKTMIGSSWHKINLLKMFKMITSI